MGKTQDQIDMVLEEFFKLLHEAGKRFLYQNGSLYCYFEGAWSLLSREQEEAFNPLVREACDSIGFDYATKINALWLSIKTECTPKDSVKFDQHPIVALPNCALELGDTIPMEWSPEHYTTRRLAIPYDADATCPEWEAMLDRMLESPKRTEKDRKSVARFLQQWVGINFVGPAAKLKNRALRNAIICDGPSYSGKSTFSKVVRELYGKDRIVSVSIDDLNQQFGKAALLTAQAIITDEGANTETKGDAKIIKALVTGEPMYVDRKFQSPIANFEFDGAVLFTTNTLPSFADETNAIYNRLLVVRMERVFSPEEAAKTFDKKDVMQFLHDKEEFPGILNWALVGFNEAWHKSKFDLPKELTEAAKMFRMRNDALFGFLHEGLEPDKSMLVPANVMTALFVEYALENYHTKMPAKKAVNSLVRNVREVYPNVEFENPLGGSQVLNYLGVRLSDLGMAYWAKVQQKQLPSVEGVRKPHSRRA